MCLNLKFEGDRNHVSYCHSIISFFAPTLGIFIAYGFGSLLLLSIPIMLLLCGVAGLILWPINKYFDNPNNERKYRAWVDSLFAKSDAKRRRETGDVTTEETNAVIQYFDEHRSFKACPTYLSLSPPQKQTMLKHMYSYNSYSVMVIAKDSERVSQPR